MSREHPERQSANSANKSTHVGSIPRWVVIGAAILVLLPVLIVSSMMLVMGLFGPPLHGGMTTFGSGIVPVVGLIPLLLALTGIYGVYRLYKAGTE